MADRSYGSAGHSRRVKGALVSLPVVGWLSCLAFVSRAPAQDASAPKAKRKVVVHGRARISLHPARTATLKDKFVWKSPYFRTATFRRSSPRAAIQCCSQYAVGGRDELEIRARSDANRRRSRFLFHPSAINLQPGYRGRIGKALTTRTRRFTKKRLERSAFLLLRFHRDYPDRRFLSCIRLHAFRISAEPRLGTSAAARLSMTPISPAHEISAASRLDNVRYAIRDLACVADEVIAARTQSPCR